MKSSYYLTDTKTQDSHSHELKKITINSPLLPHNLYPLIPNHCSRISLPFQPLQSRHDLEICVITSSRIGFL